MNKILVIAGQTATGKTNFAVEVAKKFNGELISADSRQVYKGMDIVTGKDKNLIKEVPIWLYDLINPNEPFSVSLWHEKAMEAVTDIASRGKLPIVVGGTGLYLRSLINNLDQIVIPPNPEIRQKLAHKSVSELFTQLSKLDPIKANCLNNSDRHNPRRLIRAIEIELSPEISPKKESKYLILTLTLTCSNNILKLRISDRVMKRIQYGAMTELQQLSSVFNLQSSGFSACGYKSLLKSQDPKVWIRSECQYARRQLIFFKKYLPENHFDISESQWSEQALDIIRAWINNSSKSYSM